MFEGYDDVKELWLFFSEFLDEILLFVDDFFLEFEVFFEFDIRFIYGFCVDFDEVINVVVDCGDLWLFWVLFELDDFKGM